MTTPEPEMRLVPVEPTDEMHHAGQAIKDTYNASDIYRAMLAAAPAQSNPVSDNMEIEKQAYKRGWDDREADILERAERIAPASPPEAGWRTMETAPKDGAEGSIMVVTIKSGPANPPEEG